IHTVASDSVLAQLERHASPETEVLVEVNVAGEPGKAGVAPPELGEFIERCPVRVVGLMTMPPFSTDPEASRPAFARLAGGAGRRAPGAPRRRARSDPARDGHEPGLGDRRGGGSDDHPTRHHALHIEPAYRSPR